MALLTACSQASDAANSAADTASEKASQAASAVAQKAKDVVPGANISDAPAGIYKSEASHAYITFQYLHQGFTRPTLRWNEFEATVNLDPENPTDSTLSVTIEADSIDSGVAKFDEYLVSPDFFDVDNHPEITFVSKNLSQGLTGRGKLTGDLTMKGITKPVTLDVTLNKVGNHFRSKKPMMGISATGKLKRSDWDLGLYTPNVGDDVDISIEVEFIKDGE